MNPMTTNLANNMTIKMTIKVCVAEPSSYRIIGQASAGRMIAAPGSGTLSGDVRDITINPSPHE